MYRMYFMELRFRSWITKQSEEEGGSADASVVSAAARENRRFLGAVDWRRMRPQMRVTDVVRNYAREKRYVAYRKNVTFVGFPGSEKISGKLNKKIRV